MGTHNGLLKYGIFSVTTISYLTITVMYSGIFELWFVSELNFSLGIKYYTKTEGKTSNLHS